MRGSQSAVDALRRHGVRVIFSLSGNQIMPLYDACIDVGIRIVHVRHEAAAVFMADAWAQVTGEIGVALLTAGPGFCNGLSPVYSALQAESPVLLLTGDSPIAEDGAGAFQELDQIAMSRPVTKLSRRVGSASAVSSAVDEAISIAHAGRPGPVHLALPHDVLKGECGAEERSAARGAAVASAPSDSDAKHLADLIDQAERPIIIGGPTSARSRFRHGLLECSRRMSIPMITMESPRGLRDPSLGSVARHVAHADLVVTVGKDIDFGVGFGRTGTFDKGAEFIVLDADAEKLDRAQRLLGGRARNRWQCDPFRFLTEVAMLRKQWPAREKWMQMVTASIASRDLAGARPAAKPGCVDTRDLCEHVQRFLQSASMPLLVCDGGEFGQWAQGFCSAPVRIVNGSSGAIGGGLCYAIAAKIARPECTVLALMGDGSSGFHFMEFDTAVRENAPFIAIVGADDRWNAEYLIQMRDYGIDRLIGCELSATARYEQVATALGGYGASVDRIEDIDRALKRALDSARPACISVSIPGEAAPVFE